ncbi:MAG: hypothetical protein PSV26_13940 [Polaromonas sp.]|uniref:hypothetical protein n=1 Tax=Polaromonas sp. TaxID=1869339 RepID=UPI00248A6E9B|nr:hypothetical protein [Polaromonas sp.]MDI1238578.1 hypothetical protein [Polaromonas sp.]
MTDLQQTRSVWRMAARPLVLGAIMCTVAAALVGGASWLAQSIAVEQGKAQAVLDAANLSLENTQSDRARLEENLQMFGKLKQSHFAHAPDRLAMLEALEAAASDLKKSTLVWELGAQEKIRPLNDDKTGETVAHLVRVPMKLGVSGVHEQEWISLLARLQGGNAGYFTSDSCIYDQKIFTNAGLSAPAVDVRCELSWLYVVAEGAAPKAP